MAYAALITAITKSRLVADFHAVKAVPGQPHRFASVFVPLFSPVQLN